MGVLPGRLDYELLLSLYQPDNVTALEVMALETTSPENAVSLLGPDLLPALLKKIMVDSAKECPHHPKFDPGATPVSFL
jgi:hypothetical protein